jgi:hypothetical protein
MVVLTQFPAAFQLPRLAEGGILAMQTEEIVTNLEPWLARHRRLVWKPVVAEGDGPTAASKFCGTAWTSLDAPWPECGHCKKPLQLFLQPDLGDLPRELGGRFGHVTQYPDHKDVVAFGWACC